MRTILLMTVVIGTLVFVTGLAMSSGSGQLPLAGPAGAAKTGEPGDSTTSAMNLTRATHRCPHRR